MKPLSYPLLILLSLATACKKDTADPNGLPKATQSGENTAGFLLNGQPWLPKQAPTSSTAVGASWLQSYRQILTLQLGRWGNGGADQQDLNIVLPSLRRPGAFQINQFVDPNVVGGMLPAYAIYNHQAPAPRRLYLTGPRATGQVTLTRFDTVARIVSGTFDLTVRQYGGSDSLRFTDGRFDLRF